MVQNSKSRQSKDVCKCQMRIRDEGIQNPRIIVDIIYVWMAPPSCASASAVASNWGTVAPYLTLIKGDVNTNSSSPSSYEVGCVFC